MILLNTSRENTEALMPNLKPQSRFLQLVRRYTGVESNEVETDEVIKYRKAIDFFTV